MCETTSVQPCSFFVVRAISSPSETSFRWAWSANGRPRIVSTAGSNSASIQPSATAFIDRQPFHRFEHVLWNKIGGAIASRVLPPLGLFCIFPANPPDDAKVGRQSDHQHEGRRISVLCIDGQLIIIARPRPDFECSDVARV